MKMASVSLKYTLIFAELILYTLRNVWTLKRPNTYYIIYLLRNAHSVYNLSGQIWAYQFVFFYCSACRYESHYGLPLGRKKGKKEVEPSEDDPLAKKKSHHLQRKLEERRKDNKAKMDSHVEDQFLTGRLYGKANQKPVNCMKMFIFVSPSLRVIQTRAEWTLWWVHFGRERVGILHEETQVKEDKVAMTIIMWQHLLSYLGLMSEIEWSLLPNPLYEASGCLIAKTLLGV